MSLISKIASLGATGNIGPPISLLLKTARCASTTSSIIIPSESSLKNDGSWIKRLGYKMGIGETNKFALRRSTIFQYEACTDKLDPRVYFEHFQLADTLYSFYLVIQLHVWMCQVRSMREGPEGRLLRNEIVERMWQDLDVRLSKIEVYSSSKRKQILEDLLFHHQGAMFSYDEGLLTDDKVLASALWRTFYSKDPVDSVKLELAVHYVRTQLEHLQKIDSRRWCLDGRFDWASFPPIVNPPIKPQQSPTDDPKPIKIVDEQKESTVTNMSPELPNSSKKSQSDQILKSDSSRNQLQKIELPDEDPDQPKKHTFQEIVKLQHSLEPIYTMEKAAEFADSDFMNNYFKYPYLASHHAHAEYCSRSYMNEYSLINHFPEATDMLVIGSGLVGSATAYYTKKEVSRSGDVLVLDKDPYGPHNTSSLSSGLISSQSKSQDVTRIAALSKELIRMLRTDIICTPEDFDQIKYRPCTHLVLWPEGEISDVLESVTRQIEDGCYTEAKFPEELELTFPWLKVTGSDIVLGTHGNQDEALIDPIGLRNLYRTLAQAYGANFIKAEVIDYNTMYSVRASEITSIGATAVVCRLPRTGELRNLGFAKSLLCLGHNTPFLEARSDMETYMRDKIGDLHFIQPKLRVYYSFHSLTAPVINFPVITDTDGSTLIRDDYSGDFKYYLTQEDSEKFFDQDPDTFLSFDSEDPYLNLIHKSAVMKEYFYTVIKPKLVNRIPLMADAVFNLAYSGFESVNTIDQSPVIGLHPFHSKVVVAAGFGSRMSTFAPIAGAALSELMLYGDEETYDMTNFYWERRFTDYRLKEHSSLLK